MQGDDRDTQKGTGMAGRTNLKDMVYNAVLQEIISGKYQPGDILNEKALTEKFEVSKSPVRDALVSLCADNVVRNIPRYGYEVIRLTQEDIYEMLQYREFLELGNLQRAYQHFGEKELDCLRRLDLNCQRDDVDPIEHWKYNAEFHVAMMEFCGNRFITENVRRCMSRLLRAYSQLYWNQRGGCRLSVDTKHHAMIIEDLAKRDPEALLRDLRGDLRDFGDFVENNGIKNNFFS